MILFFKYGKIIFVLIQKSEESSALSIFDNITERVAETRRLLVSLLSLACSHWLYGFEPLLCAKAIYPFASGLWPFTLSHLALFSFPVFSVVEP
jgi:hypothetical protein